MNNLFIYLDLFSLDGSAIKGMDSIDSLSAFALSCSSSFRFESSVKFSSEDDFVSSE